MTKSWWTFQPGVTCTNRISDYSLSLYISGKMNEPLKDCYSMLRRSTLEAQRLEGQTLAVGFGHGAPLPQKVIIT